MVDIEKLKKVARSLALENAVKFGGRANPGAVIGPLMKLVEGFNPKEHAKEVNIIVQEVNNLSSEEQKKEFESLGSVREEKVKEERNLPPLKNAEEGKVITRMPPGPSKYAHVGHAISFLINYMYAKEYNGKCILRFDDTNPDVDAQEYVDSITDNLTNYLGIKPDSIIFASDDMDKFLDYAEKLIEQGNAYTCNCPSEKISEDRRAEKACIHRDQNKDEIRKSWEEMKNGTAKDTVLRLKINMQHKNAVMRDPAIYRVNTNNHYRQKNKYSVWPLYDFESSIEDGLNKVTHVLRTTEFDSRIELHNYMATLLGFSEIEYKHYGRANIVGAVTQGREIRKLIESGEYIGWDDPRLVTLLALKRRGIVKETFYELTKKAGLSKSNTNIDFTVIAAINRQILDKSAKRFYFIENPKEIVVDGAPNQEIILDIHPDNMKAGRRFNTNNSFLIEKADDSSDEIRLIDCLNYKEGKFLSTSFQDFNGKNKIHWLPNDKKQIVNVEILMPENKTKKGIGEKTIGILDVGDVIQFERFGFCRLDSIDKKNNTFKFYFTHK
ncbi:glutamate--tRNA ligase [Candidatus Woesearchaeota archaeon]|nr:MAG: glutamate--tRNA ligase [Candidatus Woesearchaeota archaeon]